MRSLSVVRYLTFELSRTCNMAKVHPKCPVSHPDRYRFGHADRPLTDGLVLEFWRWCVAHGFRGLVSWSSYSEPTLILRRIHALMKQMRLEDAHQPFILYTNNPTADATAFDLVKVTDYSQGKQLDDRLLSLTGEGDYAKVKPQGWCGRGWGWEVLIDHYGNWDLCCNDWRCEESVGNIHVDPWDELFWRYYQKSTEIRWRDQAGYERLPRMCRACLVENPALHMTGNTYEVP